MNWTKTPTRRYDERKEKFGKLKSYVENVWI